MKRSPPLCGSGEGGRGGAGRHAHTDSMTMQTSKVFDKGWRCGFKPHNFCPCLCYLHTRLQHRLALTLSASGGACGF